MDRPATSSAAIPLRLVLARTDELVIAITEATAYPNGFEFKLVVRSKQRPSHPYDSPFEFGHPAAMWRHQERAAESGELPPELFRFGIEFADGAKATTVGAHPFEQGLEQEPKGPVLIERRRWKWELGSELLGLAASARRHARLRLRVAGEGRRADSS